MLDSLREELRQEDQKLFANESVIKDESFISNNSDKEELLSQLNSLCSEPFEYSFHGCFGEKKSSGDEDHWAIADEKY